MADEIDTLTLSINKLNDLLKKMVDLTTKEIQVTQAAFNPNATVTKIDPAPLAKSIGDSVYQAIKSAYSAVTSSNASKVTQTVVRGIAASPQTAGQAAAAGVGKAASAVSAPLDIAGKITGPLNAALGGISGTIQSAFGPIASLVSKVNPALVEQFEMAFADLQAVMGDALQPILKVGVQLIRQFADVLETMRPAIDPLIKIISDMIKKWGELFTFAAGVWVPILGAMSSVLEGLMPVFNAVIDGFKLLYQAMKWFVNSVIDLANFLIRAVNHLLPPGVNLGQIGRKNFSDLAPQSAFGKAIRDVSYRSGEDLGAATRQAAFGQAVNWQEETVKKLEEIKKNQEASIQKEVEQRVEQIQEQKRGSDALEKTREMFQGWSL